MMEKLKNDLLYVCSLIEYIGRDTCNHRSYVVEKMGQEMIDHLISNADINHCLSYDQVAEEVKEDADIQQGDFDSVGECHYNVPSPQAIGKVYQRLIWSVKENDLAESVYHVFHSFLSDRISDFNSSLYYSSPEYLLESYRAGVLLDD